MEIVGLLYILPFIVIICVAFFFLLRDATAEGLDSYLLGFVGLTLGWALTRAEEHQNDGPKERTFSCFECGKKDAKYRCQKCKMVWYCGTECQSKAWPQHKDRCIDVNKTLESRDGMLNHAKSFLESVEGKINKGQNTASDGDIHQKAE